MFPLTSPGRKGIECKRWNTRFCGSAAGKLCGKGYLQTSINGASYMLHRLAWVIMTGSGTMHQIDHIDGNKTNNAWVNLREATQSQNLCNTGANRNNSLGFKGVNRHNKTGKFQARITIGGERKYLGLFDTPEEAAETYKKHSLLYHGEFSVYRRRVNIGYCEDRP